MACISSVKYFSYRAGILQRDLNELFRVGRRSLGISVFLLIACLVSGHLAGGFLIEALCCRVTCRIYHILVG